MTPRHLILSGILCLLSAQVRSQENQVTDTIVYAHPGESAHIYFTVSAPSNPDAYFWITDTMGSQFWPQSLHDYYLTGGHFDIHYVPVTDSAIALAHFQTKFGTMVRTIKGYRVPNHAGFHLSYDSVWGPGDSAFDVMKGAYFKGTIPDTQAIATWFTGKTAKGWTYNGAQEARFTVADTVTRLHWLRFNLGYLLRGPGVDTLHIQSRYHDEVVERVYPLYYYLVSVPERLQPPQVSIANGVLTIAPGDHECNVSIFDELGRELQSVQIRGESQDIPVNRFGKHPLFLRLGSKYQSPTIMRVILP